MGHSNKYAKHIMEERDKCGNISYGSNKKQNKKV
jgi:hypothetical protein